MICLQSVVIIVDVIVSDNGNCGLLCKGWEWDNFDHIV